MPIEDSVSNQHAHNLKFAALMLLAHHVVGVWFQIQPKETVSKLPIPLLFHKLSNNQSWHKHQSPQPVLGVTVASEMKYSYQILAHSSSINQLLEELEEVLVLPLKIHLLVLTEHYNKFKTTLNPLLINSLHSYN